MLYQKFIQLVEDHAEELTRRWIKEVKTNPSTPGYQKMSEKILDSRIYDVYKRLGSYLLQNESIYYNVAEHFIRLGRERANEGLNVSEVIYALILARVVLWNYIQEESLIGDSLTLSQALGFYDRVNTFFDKAAFFVAQGYETSHLKEDDIFEGSDFVNKAVNSVMRWFLKK